MAAAFIRQVGDIVALTSTNSTRVPSRWWALNCAMMEARSASPGFSWALALVVVHPSNIAAAIIEGRISARRQDGELFERRSVLPSILASILASILGFRCNIVHHKLVEGADQRI